MKYNDDKIIERIKKLYENNISKIKWDKTNNFFR
jgi:hypothetical protein